MKAYATPVFSSLSLRDVRAVAASVPNLFRSLKSTDRAAREEILHRAYALWESEGRPQNRALAHWLQAEIDVMQGSSGHR